MKSYKFDEPRLVAYSFLIFRIFRRESCGIQYFQTIRTFYHCTPIFLRMMEPNLGGEIGMSNLPSVWGYPSLADYLATKPEASIFCPFSALTIRDLLYRQAELKKLQDEHERLEWRDYQSQRDFNDGPCYAKNWEDLSVSDEKGHSSEQWEHFQLIQEKLWAYSRFSPFFSGGCVLISI